VAAQQEPHFRHVLADGLRRALQAQPEVAVVYLGHGRIPASRRHTASHTAHVGQQFLCRQGSRGDSTGSPHNVCPDSPATRVADTACRRPEYGNHLNVIA
jgi:hypothetical protein